MHEIWNADTAFLLSGADLRKWCWQWKFRSSAWKINLILQIIVWVVRYWTLINIICNVGFFVFFVITHNYTELIPMQWWQMVIIIIWIWSLDSLLIQLWCYGVETCYNKIERVNKVALFNRNFVNWNWRQVEHPVLYMYRADHLVLASLCRKYQKDNYTLQRQTALSGLFCGIELKCAILHNYWIIENEIENESPII